MKGLPHGCFTSHETSKEKNEYFERQNKLFVMTTRLYLGTKFKVQKIECEHYSKNILKLLNSICIRFV